VEPKSLTIAAMLAARAGDGGARPAILAPRGDGLTHAELGRALARARTALRERGIGSRDRVAIVLPNGAEMAVAFLSVAAAAAAAPLNPAYTESELAFSFSDLRVRAVLLGAEPLPAAVAAAQRLSLPVLTLRPRAGEPAGAFDLEGAAVSGEANDSDPGPEDVALVLHTSGTTARPKIVPLTQRNLVRSALAIQRWLALGADDRCLNAMPLFHIHGLMAALLASLAGGGSAVCTAGFRAAELEGWLTRLAPTWYTAVPTIHQAVLDATAAGSAARDARLRFVRSSSAPLPARLLHELEARFGAPVVEAYGMTEASHQIASNPVTGGRRAGSVGVAVGVEVAVVDTAGRPLPPGTAGEVVIRGESVTAGYENDEAANRAAFLAGGWLRTGDQGVLGEDGDLRLTGRLKELINRGGEKIAPREIEEALLRHPEVAQAVAFAAPHPTLGEEVAAAVVLRGAHGPAGECAGREATTDDLRHTAGVAGREAIADELRRTAAATLAAFKVPRRIAIVAEIPKGATGKVQRAGLAHALGLDRAGSGGEPARSPLERAAAAEWARILGVERVGLEDDFFDLGGDSLAAVEMMEAMAVLLEGEVPIADFLERPTIANLLALRQRGRAEDPDLVPLRSRGDEPPIFCTTLHDGGLWRVARLMRHLPRAAPVLGLRLPPVPAQGAPASIEQIAARHVAVLERVHPDGPVRLVGPCFGGTVALAMAIELERRGRPVELLAMLNSFNRGWRNDAAAVAAAGTVLRARHLLARLRFHAERLRARAPREGLAYLQARAELVRRQSIERLRHLAFELAVGSGLPRPAALRRIADASRWAQARYRPRPYGGRVLLVRAGAPIAGVYPLPLLGWAGTLRGEVEVMELACEQLELWSDEALMRQVACRIAAALPGGRDGTEGSRG